MGSSQRGEVEGRDGTRIAWHLHGEVGPTVLLTNGIGTTENFWRFLVADLSRDHRVAHWDYRGHGRSGRSTAKDYAIATHADDLARVTRAVWREGEPPPVHVAFSMGVAVVLEFTRRQPEAVRGLALIAGAPQGPGVGTWVFAAPGSLAATRAAFRLLGPAVPLVAPVVQAVMRSPLPYPFARALGVLQPHAPRADIDQMMEGMAAMDPVAYWESLRSLLDTDASDVLATARVPVAIIAAANDLMMPLSQVRRMRETLPAATFVEIEKAGHAGLVEQGPKMVEAVRALLARAEAPR